ncbi:MAG: hypothetical protein K0R47_5972, partial [Brevibacillus sp.]|nr:hypothetical protein [Brevibacillus sp.]
METLDKQKLIEWLQNRWLLEAEDNEPERAGVYYGIKMCVESGVFDIQEEQTRSTLQNGDKVTHTKHKYLGTGIII